MSLRAKHPTKGRISCAEAIPFKVVYLLIKMKKYHVYIMTNDYNTVLYTGVTSNITKRVYEHKNKLVDGFTKRYNISKLVYAEEYGDINEALRREKQIKAGSRKNKIELIKRINPDFNDIKVI